MNDWSPPQRPSEYVEQILVTSILDGTFPAGSSLPAERELANQLGITRPTLREVLKHLACDGWLTIHQGRSTMVNDFWQDGGLNMLSTLVRFTQSLPNDFVPNLLEVRLALAPAYTRSAVIHHADMVTIYLEDSNNLKEDPHAFAGFDWHLHRTLTIASGNPIFTLILNGFASFYEEMAYRYFISRQARDLSRQFYNELHDAANKQDPDAAEKITHKVMLVSIDLWNEGTIKPPE